MRFIPLFLSVPMLIFSQTVSESWSPSDVELRMAMTEMSEQGDSAIPGSELSAPLKKPGLGLIMSAAVPGTGEMYGGSWVKGAVILGVEVALWAGYQRYTDEGDRLEKSYRAFGDENWVERDYWVHMAEEASAKSGWEHLEAVNETNYQDYLDIEDGLRDYELTIGSHSLHVVKDQQYYEMIGKYHQFRAGWRDSDSTHAVVTPLRAKYEDMEYDMDAMYKKAGLCTMVILANHVISALDAVWTVNRYNRRIRVTPNIGLIRTRESLHPAFTMRIGW